MSYTRYNSQCRINVLCQISFKKLKFFFRCQGFGVRFLTNVMFQITLIIFPYFPTF